MSSDVVVAFSGLFGTIIVAYLGYRAGVVRTQTDSVGVRQDDRRDDFTAITEKYADIIDRLESAANRQQEQIERQEQQIDTLRLENKRLKNKLSVMIEELGKLRISLDGVTDIDTNFIHQIDDLHKTLVQGEPVE